MIERVEYHGELLALIIRCEFSPVGVNFLTKEDNYLQVGVFEHDKGKMIKPHYHKEITRSINITQEVLHLEYGKIEAFFFSGSKEVAKSVLFSGDTIILINGGHGFKVLEDTKMIEVKQGPYISPEKDKKPIFTY